MRYFKKRKPTSLQLIVLGYIAIVAVGTALLALPFSSKSGEAIPFINALFTSTSATCVTGLIVYDTYTQFTRFGQTVILFLIQIGGLGFMTLMTVLWIVLGKKIGLSGRHMLAEDVNAFHVGGVVKLIRRIVVATALFETLGAALLAIRFCPQFGVFEGIYYAVFHAVSAFCNAGFDLMGRLSPYASLIPYRQDILVNVTVMVLIVAGGLGFVVWNDIAESGWRFARYKLHSKIVLVSTGILILSGALVFFFSEQRYSLSGQTLREQILASFFQSVSPRTAGFCTVDPAAFSNAGLIVTMLLMLIGASPGSTGGGIKTTTFAVMLFSLFSYVKNTNDINLLQRRLESSASKKAFSLAMLYLLSVLIGMFLLVANQQLGFADAMFETLSAIGTVGTSTGITRDLNSVSRLIVTLLMFGGRVGGITIAMAFLPHAGKIETFKNPEEKMLIG